MLLKLLRKSISLLILSYSHCFVNSQENVSYILDTVYLPNTSIKYVSSSGDNDFWILTNESSPRLLRINEHGEIKDLSQIFELQIKNGITCIASAGYNKLLIGTESDFAYYYDSDTVYHLNEEFGIKSSHNHINSIVFTKNPNYYNYQFLITTNGSYYSSAILGKFYENIEYQNEKLYSKDLYYVITKTNAIETEINYFSNSYIFAVGKIPFEKYGKVLSVYISFYDNGALGEGYVGTEKGLIHKGYWNYYDSLKIYDILTNLMATDSGLYISNKRFNWNNEDYEAYQIAENKKLFMVATNKGLLSIKHVDCDSYSVAFSQDKEYLCLEKNDSVLLNSNCNQGTESWHWDFGDSTSAKDFNTSHKYLKKGNYLIKLTGTNGYCTKTVESKIVVYEKSSLLNLNFESFKKAPFNRDIDKGAVNIIDFNNDERQDFLMPGVGLYENVDSSIFTLRKKEFKLGLYDNAICGDMDNDGLNDIITETDVYKNMGNFVFKPVFEKYFGSFNIFDYNNDGLLDIIGRNEEKLNFYKNMGSMYFSKDFDIDIPEYNYISQLKRFDINHDGILDLILILNCQYSNCVNNRILISEKGTFKQIEYPGITDKNGINCMIADLNNDKKLDILLNSGYDHLIQKNRTSILINTGDSLIPYNKSTILCSESGTLFDADNNGWLDYVQHNENYFKENYLFLNSGDLIFVQRRDSLFAEFSESLAKSSVVSDLDQNGFSDIIFGSGDGSNTHFDCVSHLALNKTNNGNNWIKINCFGTKSNYNAIGALISIKANINDSASVWQSRLIEDANTLWAQNGYELHFGLGKASKIDTIEIKWPSGISTIYTQVSINKTHHFVEPFLRYHGDTICCDNKPLVFSMPKFKGLTYEWYLNDSLIIANESSIAALKSGRYKCKINEEAYSYFTPDVNIKIKQVPKANIWFKEGKNKACENESLEIQSDTFPNAQYTWITNNGIIEDYKPELKVTFAGTWQQVLIAENGCRDTSQLLEALYFSLPKIDMQNEFSFCKGNSVTITAPSNYKDYSWSTGEKGLYITVKDPGEYTLTVTDSNNCSGNKTLTVRDYDLTVNMQNEFAFCKGDSVTISAPSNYTDYTWSTGEKELKITVKNPGEYTLTVVDSNNCSGKKNINVVAHDLPIVDLGPDTVLAFSEIAYVPLKSCNYNYIYHWFDNIYDCHRKFSPISLGFGTHKLWITIYNQYNCKYTDTVKINILPRAGENLEQELLVFPNPAKNNECNLYFPKTSKKEISIEITNETGILIRKLKFTPTELTPVQKMNIGNFNKGIYYIKAYNTDFSKVQTLKK